jgi:hypothetical protein
VGGLGAVNASSIFGLVRRAGAFAVVLLTFVLVSRMQLAQQYRDNDHFLSTTSSSRRETMVGVSLTRASLSQFIINNNYNFSPRLSPFFIDVANKLRRSDVFGSVVVTDAGRRASDKGRK